MANSLVNSNDSTRSRTPIRNVHRPEVELRMVELATEVNWRLALMEKLASVQKRVNFTANWNVWFGVSITGFLVDLRFKTYGIK